MSHPLAVGEILEGRVYCKHKDQGSVNTAHWRVSAVTGTVLDDELAKQLDLGVSTPLTALLNSQAQYMGSTAQKVFPLPRTVAVINSTTAGFGAASRPALPGHVAGLIQKRTNLAGPKFRGRAYVPFPSEVDNEDIGGVPTAAYKTNLMAYAAVLFGGFSLAPLGGGTATLVPVIFHQSDGSFTDVVSYARSDLWAVQLRRGDRGKPNKTPFD